MRQSQSAAKSAAGIAELFEPPKLAVEKLPQLRALFERLSAGSAEEFNQLLTAPATCFLNQVEAGDSWDIIDSMEHCIAALFYVAEWDAHILLAIEKRLLFSMMDAMYGGDGSEPPLDNSHPLTSLDLQIARELFERASRALQAAISPLADIRPTFERVESEIEFTILGPQNIPSVYAQILVQVHDHGGRLFLLVPRAPLMPLRKKLERGTLRESQSEDPGWSQQLHTKVATTNVPVRAIVSGPRMSLGEIGRFTVGQVIALDAMSGPDIVMEAGGAPLFKCRLGQLDGRFSLKIDGPAGAAKDFVDSLLAGTERT